MLGWKPLATMVIMGATAGVLRAELPRLRKAAQVEEPGINTHRRGARIATDAATVKLEKASFLGISASPVPVLVREQLKLKKGLGLVVDHVEAGSPAEAAGIKQYDVLYQLEDQILINAHQFAVLIRRSKPDDEIKLSLYRGGKLTTVVVKPQEKEVGPLDPDNFWVRGGIIEYSQEEGVRGVEIGVAPEPIPTEPMKLLPRQGTVKGVECTAYIREDEAGRLWVSATDKAGRTVFDGSIATKEQREKMPKEVAAMVGQFERAIGTNQKSMPAQAQASRNEKARTFSWSNEQYTWQVSVRGTGSAQRFNLRAKDKKGNVIFDGQVALGREARGLPKPIAEWFNAPATQEMLKEGTIGITAAPVRVGN